MVDEFGVSEEVHQRDDNVSAIMAYQCSLQQFRWQRCYNARESSRESQNDGNSAFRRQESIIESYYR